MGERVFSVTLADGSHHRPDLIVLPPGHPLSHSAVPALAAHDRTRPRGGSDPSEISGCQARGERSRGIDARGREISGDHELRPAEAEDVRVGALEVELSPKGSERLDAIVTGYHEAVEAGRFSSVRYLCSEEALSFVRRSVDRTEAAGAVVVELRPAGVCDARWGSS